MYPAPPLLRGTGETLRPHRGSVVRPRVPRLERARAYLGRKPLRDPGSEQAISLLPGRQLADPILRYRFVRKSGGHDSLPCLSLQWLSYFLHSNRRLLIPNPALCLVGAGSDRDPFATSIPPRGWCIL